MTGATMETPRPARATLQTLLVWALFAQLALHAALLLPLNPHPILASRLSTAAAPLLAALCGLWRAQQLPLRERLPWRLLSASLLLWFAGQAVEALIGKSPSALNFAPDAADYFNLVAAFPMLLTLSNTRRTESLRSVFYLDGAQAILAASLICILLRNASANAAASAMANIYLAECGLLAVSATVRLVTRSTLEERRRIHLIFQGVWLFLPIHLFMHYAASRWSLPAGTLFDLLWSIPFVYAGWRCLRMPMSDATAAPLKEPNRPRLLVEGLCPFLVMVALFALAAAVTLQHPLLGLAAIFALLLIQSLHAGVVQLNYVTVQRLLLQREHELREANTDLEQLSMLDPLTGIPNRRRFDAAFDDAWRRELRRRRPIALLIIDLDYFKGINDRHGHTYGDECLVAVARVLGEQAGRPDDLLARYGGDEFILLLPDIDVSGARRVAERMHDAVRLLAAANSASPFDGRLTVTIGIGVGKATTGADPIALIDAADQALYRAKQRGRNTTCAQDLTHGAPLCEPRI